MRPMTDAEKDLAIEGVNRALKELGLEPWKDGRSVTDGKRPWEQHVGMVLSALKAELDAAELQIHDLMEFVRDIADDWDCDSDSHKYGTACRACQAKALRKKYADNRAGVGIEDARKQVEALKQALQEAVDVPQYMIRSLDMPPAMTIKPEARALLENAEVHLKAIESRTMRKLLEI